MAEAEAVLKILPRKLGTLASRPPQWFFSRPVQVLLDGTATTVAVFCAYMLRFEFNVHTALSNRMWTWVVVIAMSRPIISLALKGYDSTWRFFCLRDQLRLALHALPLTIVLAGVRYAFYPPFTVPYSVIALEYCVFLMAASGMRILRRVTYQRLIPATRSVNTLLVGSGSSLAGAIRHVELYNDVKLVGLVTDDSVLRGLRISGVPVLGPPESLPRLLASLGWTW